MGLFTRDIKVTVLGNTGSGKTTLINRMKGEDVKKVISKKTIEINVESKKIKLKSSNEYPWYHPEHHMMYRIVAIDNPGDYKLRRKWREAMRKFKTDGMLFLLDPEQSVEVQRVAMEDSYNYFLDSLHLDPDKADEKAKSQKYIFMWCVNKMDIFVEDKSQLENFKITPEIKDKGVEFLSNFSKTMNEFRKTFPLGKFGISYISAIYSPYSDLDKLFEVLKVYLYQT